MCPDSLLHRTIVVKASGERVLKMFFGHVFIQKPDYRFVAYFMHLLFIYIPFFFTSLLLIDTQ